MLHAVIPVSAELMEQMRVALKAPRGPVRIEPEPCPCCERLRTALAAVTRATTLMEAVHVATSAAGGGSVGCATPHVVGCCIERTT